MTNILKIQHWHMSIAFYPQWWMNCVSIPRYYIYFFYVKAFLMTILLESISKSCHILEKRTWSTRYMVMKFIFCLGLVWSMDGQKPIHHFPTLVYTEAVSTFVEKMMSYVMLLNERLWHFFYKKRPKKNLWCQIDFLIICNLFWSNHFLIRCQTKVLLKWNLSIYQPE